jgi:hypothetical protein
VRLVDFPLACKVRNGVEVLGVGLISVQVTANKRQNRFRSRDVLINRHPTCASFPDRACRPLTTLLAKLNEILH